MMLALTWPVASVWIAFALAGGMSGYAMFRGGSTPPGALLATKALERLSREVSDGQHAIGQQLRELERDLTEIKVQVADLQRVLREVE